VAYVEVFCTLVLILNEGLGWRSI